MRVNHRFNSIKPKGPNAGRESNEISKVQNSQDDWLFEELLSAVLNGQTVVCENFFGKRLQKNFLSTDLICLDFDHEPKLNNIIDDLRGLNINPYLIHETFSSQPDDLRYHVFIRFDRHITDVNFLLKLYKYLENNITSVVDDSTTNNICRLVFSTNKEIPDNLRFKEITNLKDLDIKAIQEVAVAPKSMADKIFDENNVEIKNTLKSVDKEAIEQVLKDFDHEVSIDDNYDIVIRYIYAFHKMFKMGYEQALYDAYDITRNHNRRGSVGVIERYIKGSATFEYMHADSWKIYHRCIIETKPITQTYDILKDMHVNRLEDNEYITPNIIHDLLNGNNLLVAPPGSGKTTAIIKYALSTSKGERTILCVPTITIAEKLHETYAANPDVTFIYSKKKSKGSYFDGEANAKLIITTYKGFQHLGCRFDDTLLNTPNLIIDEAHEFISFAHMAGQRANIRDMFRLMEGGMPSSDEISKIPALKKVLWVTATPFNLADVFDKKVLFKKKYDKDITFHKTSNKNKQIIKLIQEEQFGRDEFKCLIYLNSVKKATNLVNKLKSENIKAAYLDSPVAKSNSAEWNSIKVNERTDVDVVVCTKILNIGVDCQGVFDTLIYANDRLDINSCVQFSNRDRQAKSFIVMHAKDETKQIESLINSYHSRHTELTFNSNMSEADLEQLDQCRANDRLNPHFLTEFFPYQKLINIDVVIDVFSYLFEDFDYTTTNDGEDKAKPLPRDKVKEIALEVLTDYGIENLYKAYIDNELLKLIKGTNKKVVTYIKALFRSLDYSAIGISIAGYRVDNGEPILKLSGELNGVDVNDIAIDKLMLYRDCDVWLKRLDDTTYADMIRDIASEPVITAQERDAHIAVLNEYKCPLNQREWNERNFNKRLESYGLLLSKKKIREGQDLSWITINETIYNIVPDNQV